MTDLIKRGMDLLVASVLLVALFPVLMLVAVFVRLRLGSPILFVQERPGLNGMLFRMYKFRTMSNEKDAIGRPLDDAARLNHIGRFLRASSLDELPELFNVLRGDMSLVGPRPLLKSYLPLYTKEQMRRHEVRPGITGWAQINGRNTLDWDQRFLLDVWYVDNRTLPLDIKIIWRTIFQVFAAHGINSPGSATMHPFEGANSNGIKSDA